jgi:methyl-accepting chemotaxis protein
MSKKLNSAVAFFKSLLPVNTLLAVGNFTVQSAKLPVSEGLALLNYQQRLLKLFSLCLLVLATLASVIILLVVIFIRSRFDILSLSVSALLLSLFTLWCSQNQRRVMLGSWSLIVALNLVLMAGVYASSHQSPTKGLFLFVTIISLFLLPGWATWLLTFVQCGYIFISYTANFGSDPYLAPKRIAPLAPPGYANDFEGAITNSLLWSMILLLCTLTGVFLAGQLKRLVSVTLVQARQLDQSLKALQLRQQTGQEVSQNMFNLATALTTNAELQSEGSLQQEASVAQINTSMQELVSTASQIAELSESVNHAAREVAEDSRQIETTTSTALEQSSAGQAAVGQTIAVSEQVAALYQQLLVVIKDLAAKNAQIRSVVDIMQSLSSETHLLSLNAAIEAAGAGQYGERFGVVAQEVRNLATRSATAGSQVVTIVAEIERATQQAVASAQQGYTTADQMKATARQTGQVIAQLDRVAQRSHEQARSICDRAYNVQNLSDTIRITTIQQRSASQQVLEALQNLGGVARQGVQSSSLVSETAHNMEDLAQSLVVTLDK